MIEVKSPWDGRDIGAVPKTDARQAEAALAEATAAHVRGALPKGERARILRQASTALENEAERFALRIAEEGGKPLRDARVEVARAAAGLGYLAGEIERLAGFEIPMGTSAATAGRLAVTTFEPIGVVVAISAFNHPLNLLVHQVAVALAAGCPVLIKPALETPLTCVALVELFARAGANDIWCLLTDNATTERLACDPRVAYVSFIGSAAVGWSLRSKLAPGTRIGLEHGGSAPLIIGHGADLERAVELVAKGGYYHAGQVCVSVQRVFVLSELIEPFTARLEAKLRSLSVGDPRSEATDVGPLIRQREVGRVLEWFDEGRRSGGRAVVTPELRGDSALSPGLLRDPAPTSRVVAEEVFGPVVSLFEVASLDEAIDGANRSRHRFQAAILTEDLSGAMRAARRLDAASVMINDHTAFRADWMPFGGRGVSGLGQGGLGGSLREMSSEKLIVMPYP